MTSRSRLRKSAPVRFHILALENIRSELSRNRVSPFSIWPQLLVLEHQWSTQASRVVWVVAKNRTFFSRLDKTRPVWLVIYKTPKPANFAKMRFTLFMLLLLRATHHPFPLSFIIISPFFILFRNFDPVLFRDFEGHCNRPKKQTGHFSLLLMFLYQLPVWCFHSYCIFQQNQFLMRERGGYPFFPASASNHFYVTHIVQRIKRGNKYTSKNEPKCYTSNLFPTTDYLTSKDYFTTVCGSSRKHIKST